MIIKIPGRDPLEINHIMLDYNGTIAIDGMLIDEVKTLINTFAHLVEFHVITADTYGNVASELSEVNCHIIKLSADSAFATKLQYLRHLGAKQTVCVGNGYNDREMLQHSLLGIAVLQGEGVNTQALLHSDILCTSILDVFGYLQQPNRLKATLRN